MDSIETVYNIILLILVNTIIKYKLPIYKISNWAFSISIIILFGNIVFEVLDIFGI